MQKIFDEVNSLDKRCIKKFGLTEDILMENAASGMMRHIDNVCNTHDKILIVSGSGNNGADGIALARMLHKRYKVLLYLPFGTVSNMAKIQLQRVNKLNVKITSKMQKADVIVDCLFGSGLNRDFDESIIKLITQMNRQKAYKLACDIPSGINFLGQVTTKAFYADVTLTMGALKKSLFTDVAKEYTGKIIVANLGIQRELYEKKSSCFLLESTDLKLPFRDTKIANKGTYGHLSVILGEKMGAGFLSADAGFAFGSGLITVVSKEIKKLPNYMMQNTTLPENATALCVGMGLGKSYDEKVLENSLPKVIDADLFYDMKLVDILRQKKIVLTPHPKEFCSLLKITNIADISIETLQNNRFKYVELFCKKYPKIVLLLKGTNVIISQNKKLYVNPLGSAVLSKGGSGDVLGGLIGSLLAQGYNPLEATLSASLAHTIAAANYIQNNYSMTPEDLIKEIKKL